MKVPNPWSAARFGPWTTRVENGRRRRHFDLAWFLRLFIGPRR